MRLAEKGAMTAAIHHRDDYKVFDAFAIDSAWPALYHSFSGHAA